MKRAIAILLLILMVFSMVACGSNDVSKTIRLGSMPTLSATIYAVGIEKGIFEDNGVNVELTIFRSAPERDAAATAGTLDGFMTDMMGLINLVDGEFDFKITSFEYENFAIMANEQSGLTSQQDINNHTVGLSENTVIEYMVDMLIDSTKVEKVQLVKIPDRLAAVLSNDLNMGVFPEPFISIIKGNSGTVIATSDEANLQPVVLVFAEDAINDNDKTITSFYKAYNEIIDYLKTTDYSEYKDVLVKYGLSTEDAVDRIKVPVDKFSYAKMSSEKDFDLVVEWMLGKGLIEIEYKLEDVSTDEFVK